MQRGPHEVGFRRRRPVVELDCPGCARRGPPQQVGQVDSGPDEVPGVDAMPAVGRVGRLHDPRGGGQVGDPRPRQPLDVHEQAVLGGPSAQAGEGLGGGLEVQSPPKTSTALIDRAPTASATAKSSASPNRKTSSVSCSGGTCTSAAPGSHHQAGSSSATVSPWSSSMAAGRRRCEPSARARA